MIPAMAVGGTIALAVASKKLFGDEGSVEQSDGEEEMHCEGLLGHEDFWKDDAEAVLMSKNCKMFALGDSKGISRAVKRAHKWLELAGVDENEPVEFLEGVEERIFVKDAERTFVSDRSKKKLIKILTLCKREFGDYQQSLSFVASFLMLTLDEKNVVRLLRKINKEYIPKHWKGAADGMVVNGHVFEQLASRECPEVTAHLRQIGIVPETYVQRWFAGLTVHLNPFPSLFTFFDLFMEYKDEFLMKFGLSLFKELKSDILQVRQIDVLYEILRFDISCKVVTFDTALMQKVVDKAMTIEWDDTIDLDNLSVEAWIAVEKKMNDAANVGEIDAIEDCQLCVGPDDDKGFQDFFCEDCKKFICSDCHEEEKGTHLMEHRVVEPDLEEEEVGGGVEESMSKMSLNI